MHCTVRRIVNAGEELGRKGVVDALNLRPHVAGHARRAKGLLHDGQRRRALHDGVARGGVDVAAKELRGGSFAHVGLGGVEHHRGQPTLASRQRAASARAAFNETG